jgi:FkbM family methyltransferase
VHPSDKTADYFAAIFRSLARSLIEFAPKNPAEYLQADGIWIRFRGYEYHLTHETVFGYYLHLFEPETATLLEHASGDTFLDVGANVGQYSIPLSSHFRRVVAVEPNPVAARILLENIERNRIKNIQVITKAVTPKRGSGRAFLQPGRFLTTFRIEEQSQSGIAVPTITLDELLIECGQVDLLKVDVEGMELSLLTGAEELERVKQISVACCGGEFESLNAHLASHRFRTFVPKSSWGVEENAFSTRSP